MNYQRLISASIKDLRIKHGLTQEAFAEKLGISINGVSNIERNRYQPTAKMIDKICKTFNISPAQLLVTKSENNKEIIDNINILLANCSKKQLQKIYDIILVLNR